MTEGNSTKQTSMPTRGSQSTKSTIGRLSDEASKQSPYAIGVTMHKPVRIISIVLIGISFYLLGYLRNYVFLFINADAMSVWYHRPALIAPPFLHFTENMDYVNLLRLKWGFTFSFYIMFFLFTFSTIYLFFRKAIYLKLCAGVYAVLLLISFMFMLGGYLFQSFAAHAYNISRNLIHIGQSPFLPLLILIVIYYHRQGFRAETKQQ